MPVPEFIAHVSAEFHPIVELRDAAADVVESGAVTLPEASSVATPPAAPFCDKGMAALALALACVAVLWAVATAAAA
ncbi:hypothetical protein [Acetobacter nitrogenifigens]|uniref:hypothetical protein n=1 Tax=Acetobacter nitrogenifigens TaxID=285268 RepID=UPI001C3FE2F8|nr:hypothetical protein [Acetobacter nitrogenifigens]